MSLIDPRLKEILLCPEPDHGELIEDEAASQLVCTVCGLRFPVKDGLPSMMRQAAIAPDSAVQNAQ